MPTPASGKPPPQAERFAATSETQQETGPIAAYVHALGQTLRHPLASEAAFLTAAQYAAAGLGFLEATVVARLLGSADYGIFALATAFPALLFSLSAIKSGQVTTRYIAAFRSEGRGDELRSVCKLGYRLDLMASSLALLLVAATGWLVASRVYGLPALYWLMVLYAASFPLYALTTNSSAILSGFRRFRLLGLLLILEKGVTLVLAVGLLLSGIGVTGVVIAAAAGQALAGLSMLWAASATLEREKIAAWWKAPLASIAPWHKELRGLLGWSYVAASLGGVLAQAPVMLLGRLSGIEQAGFYRLASTLANVGAYLELALSRISYPDLSARWAAAGGKLGATLKRWTWRAGVPAGLAVLASIFLLPWLVPFFFGEGYRLMVGGTQALFAAVAVSTALFWLGSYYYASGKVAAWTKLGVLHALLVVTAGWWCIPKWQFAGMAGAAAVGRVAFALLTAGLALRAEGGVKPLPGSREATN